MLCGSPGPRRSTDVVAIDATDAYQPPRVRLQAYPTGSSSGSSTRCRTRPAAESSTALDARGVGGERVLLLPERLLRRGGRGRATTASRVRDRRLDRLDPADRRRARRRFRARFTTTPTASTSSRPASRLTRSQPCTSSSRPWTPPVGLVTSVHRSVGSARPSPCAASVPRRTRRAARDPQHRQADRRPSLRHVTACPSGPHLARRRPQTVPVFRLDDPGEAVVVDSWAWRSSGSPSTRPAWVAFRPSATRAVTVGMVLGQLASGREIEEILGEHPYLERDDVLAALSPRPRRSTNVRCRSPDRPEGPRRGRGARSGHPRGVTGSARGRT